MFLHTFGEIALNLTTLIYFIWFVPQLMLSFKEQQTASLSLGMHSLLVIGYLADFVYGFGQNLPLQYKLVTLCGLVSLMIAHYQFWCFNQWQVKEKRTFGGLTLIFVVLLVAAIYHSSFSIHNETFYNLVGLLSWFCWLLFLWPQLFKNFSNRSAQGVSMQMILLSLFTSFGDIIAAFALAWAWPSKLGSLVGLLPKFLLLLQCYYYKNAASRVAAHAF